MGKNTFFCIDAHTCGNPVRVVVGGGPPLDGTTMIAKRQHFLDEFDWIRMGLMFEPRGHDIMSGSILYLPTRDDCDLAVLFIEVSGCLPMCGHGTIGTVTAAVEHGLVAPRTPGALRLDTPAGVVEARYTIAEGRVDAVRITNVPSFLHSQDIEVELPKLGRIKVDVAYGGNFYAIVEPQEHFGDLSELTPADIQYLSPILRQRLNETHEFVHPEEPAVHGLTHVMWTGQPTKPEADARNAVLYGDKAIDRSPCGTGTSARMAQRVAKGLLEVSQQFVHESIIGTLFTGRVEGHAKVGRFDGIIPSVEGWARIHGLNTIFIDDCDPLAKGFILK